MEAAKAAGNDKGLTVRYQEVIDLACIYTKDLLTLRFRDMTTATILFRRLLLIISAIMRSIWWISKLVYSFAT